MQPRQKHRSATQLSAHADELKRAEQIYASQLRQGSLHPEAELDFLWMVALNRLEQIILDFTRGNAIESIQAEVPALIQRFERFVQFEVAHRAALSASGNVASTLEMTQREAYVSIFWLLALCKLTGHEDLVPNIISWLDKDSECNRGTDILLENTIQALTGSHVKAEAVLLHPAPYRPLGRATVYPEEQRASLIKQFLDEWYKGMRPCYWHGTHTEKRGASYFGYWALEAALVTVLWEIDDTQYRDHAYYPKDLVDWARQHSATSQIKDGPT